MSTSQALSPGHSSSRYSTRSPIKTNQILDIEKELALNSDYISSNASRLPHFSSSIEAENELRILEEKINSPQTPNKKLHTSVNSRVEKLKVQHASIQEEEDRIKKLTAISEDSKARDEQEYSEILQLVSDSRSKLKQLQDKVVEINATTATSIKSINDSKNNLKSLQTQIDKLKLEESRFKSVQEDTQHDLSQCKSKEQSLILEEQTIASMEQSTKSGTLRLKKLQQMLLQKQTEITERQEKIRNILLETEKIENHYDQVLQNAQINVSSTILDLDELSDSIPEIPQSDSISPPVSPISTPPVSPIKSPVASASSSPSRSPSKSSPKSVSKRSVIPHRTPVLRKIAPAIPAELISDAQSAIDMELKDPSSLMQEYKCIRISEGRSSIL